MADSNNDFNAMQAQLGLVGTTSFSPQGIPTPPVQFPAVRSPGEMAQALVQQAQAQTVNTIQAATMTRGSAGFGASVPGPIAAFAQQYQANMSSIQGAQMSPFNAQYMAQMTGAGSFNTGMLPSPITMTAPGMGIYRPLPSGPPITVPPVPHTPLFHTPFTAAPAAPQFATPYDYQFSLQQQHSDRAAAAAIKAPNVAAHLAADAMTAYYGSRLGSVVGASLGGAKGARFGEIAGGVAGLALSEFGGLAETAQGMANRINPMRRMYVGGAQLQSISTDFVVGGPDLAANGRGLSHQASVQLSRQMHDLASDSTFRRTTGNAYSANDLIAMTRVSGQNGLLDTSQSAEQIKNQVRDIAKTVSGFMQAANEPDFREAIKQMGQMRSMGLNLRESMEAIRDIKSAARASGTTVRGVMESGGLSGAMMFQQMGMSAGLGLRVGSGAYGMARQAVAGGAFTPQQLALFGGVQGVAQNIMEGQASMLRMPMMAAAMSGLGAGGTFTINGNAVKDLSDGKVGVMRMASMSADNLMRAVNKGGIGALAQFESDQSAIQDQVGKLLGPEGLMMMQMQQIMNTQKDLGLGKSPGDFLLAARAMGLNKDQALQMQKMANSPEFFAGMRKQVDVRIEEARAAARQDKERSRQSFVEKIGLANLKRSVSHGIFDTAESLSVGIGNYTSDREAEDAGITMFRASRALQLTKEQQQAFSAGLATKAPGEVFGNIGSSLSAVGVGGTRGRFEMMRENARAAGGLEGLLVGTSLGGLNPISATVNTFGLVTGAEQTSGILAESDDYAGGGRLINRSLNMSAKERGAAESTVAAALGGGTATSATQAQATAIRRAISRKVAAKASAEKSLIGDDGALRESDIKKKAREAMIENNMSPDAADALLRSEAGKTLVEAGVNEARLYTNSTAVTHPLAMNEADKFRQGEAQDSAVAARGKALSGIFGDVSGEEEIARANSALSAMGGDSKAKLMAALIASSRSSGSAKYDSAKRMEELVDALKAGGMSDEEIKKMQDKALVAIDHADSDTRALISKAGSRAAWSGKSIKDLLGEYSDYEKVITDTAQLPMLQKGADQLLEGLSGTDREAFISEVTSSKDGLRNALKKLTKESTMSDIDNKGTKQFLDAYAETFSSSGPDRDKKLTNMEQSFVRKILSSGAGGESSKGSNYSAEENSYRDLKSKISATENDVSKNFPESVKTLKEGSEALLEAARILKGDSWWGAAVRMVKGD